MQRDTTKHGARLDDALAQEARSLVHGAPVEARAEEWREDEPVGDLGPAGGWTGDPEALGPDPVSARRELSRHLRLKAFPADRKALLVEATAADAPEAVLAALRELPRGRTYGTVAEVWATLEGHDDAREAAAREPLSDADR